MINQIKKNPKVTIITPTIGTENLKFAIKSIQDQSFKDLIHMIIIDGEEYKDKALSIINGFDQEKIRVMILPFNTGRTEKLKFNGHRIYAACAFLVNSEYVLFLDEDNWFDEEHTESLIEMINEEDIDWAFSLRKICLQDRRFFANDDCESLGPWDPYSYLRKNTKDVSNTMNLVDTSCYAFKRDTLVKVAQYWYHPLGADRYFFKNLRTAFPKFKTTGKYTLNYLLRKDGRPMPEFFIEGNKFMKQKYNQILPWRT